MILNRLWSASGYVGAFGRAMNRVYEQEEGRPVWKLRPLQILLTLAGLIIAAVIAAWTGIPVGRLLQGESIDFYLAMSLDGISVLNDLAGGVTVTLEDDFSAADPAMTKGATLTLQGDQAEIFVRRRMDIGEGTNEARMVRQEEYLAQLSAQLESRVQQDQQFTAQVYDALQPYLVTDLAKGQLVNEVWAAKDDTVEPAIALEGEHKVAEDGFTEFYPTEASIQKAVLTLFWEPVEE